MSNGNYFVGGVLLLIGLVCIVGLFWPAVRRRKPNRRIIRVPRETLWARTNRYHGVK